MTSLLRLVTGFDHGVSRTRPLWRWLGQAGLVVLGTHLALDHLDDPLGAALGALPLPWPDPATPLQTATWVAVGLELLMVAWAVHSLARTAAREPVASVSGWWARRSLHNLAAPMAWLVLALAGCWVVFMAVEDQVALWLPAAAPWVAGVAAAAVGWRLGWSGWWGLVRRAPPPERWREGWLGAVLALSVAGLAARFALPVWGWLP
jgi:hypothetical protein